LGESEGSKSVPGGKKENLSAELLKLFSLVYQGNRGLEKIL
jgi:hypothetical protein